MRQSKRAALLPLFLLTIAVSLPMIPTAEAAGPGWAEQLQAMDEALGRGDAVAAQAAWREAYATAHASHGWPGMIVVGDAALRLGRATGTAAVSESRARRVYLTALFRARRERRLGDRDVVQQAAAIAADLAARSGDDLARRRVQAFRSQWVAGPLT
jgi:hypothetical protein